MRTRLLTIAFLSAAMLFGACQKPQVKEKSKVGGLLNFTIKIEEQEYKATKTGPYAPDEEVIVYIPSTYENPTPLDALECYASLANGAVADPVIPAICDFTLPYKVTVINADGIAQTNTIVVKYEYPRIHVEEVWSKNCEELGLQYHYTMNIAVDKDYLYILDTQQGDGKTVKVYDLNGKFVKDLPELPGICYLHLAVDDDDNLLASTYNFYNAGFNLYKFNVGSNSWEPVIIYNKNVVSVEIPANLGYKVSVRGSVDKDAYVYATLRGAFSYYEWSIKNGVVTDDSPRIKAVAPVTPNTSSSTVFVERVKDEENSPIFISTEGGNVKQAGSSFKYITEDFDEITIPVENFGHRVQSCRSFSLKDDLWLAAVCSFSEYSYSGSYLAVFDINDTERMKMKPGDDRYAFDFRMYKGPGQKSTNYTRINSLSVLPTADKTEALIFFSNPSKGAGDEKDIPDSKVFCYKLTYSK